MRRLTLIVFAAVSLVAVAHAASFTPYPPRKVGSGQELLAGGGTFAGKRWIPKRAIVAWNGSVKHLNVYFLQTTTVDCSNLKRVISRRGRVVQAYINKDPFGVRVGRRVPHVVAEFLRYTTPQEPVRLAGTERGVTLVFTRMDTSHGGVWHGRYHVKPFFQGHLYSYSGTFAANWCQLRK